MNDVVVAGKPNAVEYIRVSTEYQRYSLENQQSGIAEFAQKMGYNIIGTYADNGRSGLTAKDRAGLINLLHDVTDPERRFSIILVLDVSRWGRFQDVDQHAAYEFICREMGVRIEYAAEVFANDDSAATSILKHMKRVMAGEYSRELSGKISAAQLRCAAKGFKQGGMVGYGFRRLVVSADGKPKAVLNLGEVKVLASDRVVIIPGPNEEIIILRRIFKMFAVDRVSMEAIARTLNLEGVPTGTGLPWNGLKIKGILTNTLVVGVYSFNKKSSRLKTPTIKNPESMWIKVKVGKPLVSQKIYDKAQAIFRNDSQRHEFSRVKMLAGLSKLLKEKGRLSTAIIAACPDVPGPDTYSRHFGGLDRAYELVGYKPDRPQQSKAFFRRPCKTKWARHELLDALRRLLLEKGELSVKLVYECHYTASPVTYHTRFGSLQNAYREIGYTPNKAQPGHKSYWALHRQEALDGLSALHERHGYISQSIVNTDRSLPGAHWYRTHFGSFSEACNAAGIHQSIPELISDARCRVMKLFLNGSQQANTHVKHPLQDLPDADLIAGVRRIFQTYGYVNGRLINEDPELPSIRGIYRRYASLKHLYAKAGVSGKAPARARRAQYMHSFSAEGTEWPRDCEPVA